MYAFTFTRPTTVRQAANILAKDEDAKLLAGGETLGYRPLREAVAEYLNTSRGVKCAADQVLIVSGAQEGLDRTARLLLNPGDAVWIEDPCYLGARAAFDLVGSCLS